MNTGLDIKVVYVATQFIATFGGLGLVLGITWIIN